MRSLPALYLLRLSSVQPPWLDVSVLVHLNPFSFELGSEQIWLLPAAGSKAEYRPPGFVPPGLTNTPQPPDRAKTPPGRERQTPEPDDDDGGGDDNENDNGGGGPPGGQPPGKNK
jgi:hypothetical protein